MVREGARELALEPGDVCCGTGCSRPTSRSSSRSTSARCCSRASGVLAVCPRLAELRALPPLDGSGPARLLVRYMNALALELAVARAARPRVAAANAALELLRAAVEPSVPTSRAADPCRRCAPRSGATCGPTCRIPRSARPRSPAPTRCRCARCTRCSRTSTSRWPGCPQRAAVALPRGSPAAQRRVGHRHRLPLGVLRRGALLARVQARVRGHAERGAPAGAARRRGGQAERERERGVLAPPVGDPDSLGPPVEDPDSLGPPVGDPDSLGPPVEDPDSLGPPVEDPDSLGPPVEDPDSLGPPVEDPDSLGPAGRGPGLTSPAGRRPGPPCPRCGARCRARAPRPRCARRAPHAGGARDAGRGRAGSTSSAAGSHSTVSSSIAPGARRQPVMRRAPSAR